jgi:hypothetical protein
VSRVTGKTVKAISDDDIYIIGLYIIYKLIQFGPVEGESRIRFTELICYLVILAYAVIQACL